MQAFKSFEEFYPFYLSEHANSTNRKLHFTGTTLVIAIALYSLLTMKLAFLLLMPVAGYGFAWVGHFIVEKNRPATFKHPLWSLWGDFVMYKDMLTGKVPW
ncbi:MAG: DUF962 domain-containing protein [Hahellaceae bacterium]|nr:DUF962 domain-containing protein [Hahellaceae bacterium]MCP5211462.1 DUF962 domain-containing protein [Hahellaceae bacterium]